MSKRAPYPLEEPSSEGPQYWRSLEERAKKGDPELRKELAAEFPVKGHFTTPPSEEASDLGRRGFMTMMGAALALAGAEGCRRPIEKILPYSKMPEHVIPGIPTHYATVINRRGEALGLLVESHEGRPTKIEGNPQHPSSSGGADLIAQASILDLYDMDRLDAPAHRKDARWEAFEKDFNEHLRKKILAEPEMHTLHATATPQEFEVAISEHVKKLGAEREVVEEHKAATWKLVESDLADQLRKHEVDQGTRLRVLMQPTNSPSVVRLRRALTQRFPRARVHTYAAVSDSNAREGSRLAFGQVLQPVYAFERANVVLSLDSDFLQTEPGNVRASKGFARRRALPSRQTPAMNRLYVVEPALTVTGTCADHRARVAAADIERVLLGIADRLRTGGELPELTNALRGQTPPSGVTAQWLDAVAKDLRASPQRSIVICGSRQPATVHALVHAVNALLGNFNANGPIAFHAPSDPLEKDGVAEIRELTEAMGSGGVETLLILGGNPGYDAPADLKFAEALAKVPFSLHLSEHLDETGEKCTWAVPRAHEYEAWGDQRSFDGIVSVQQPLILPLYGGWSDIELLARAANLPERKGYDLVRATMQEVQLGQHELTNCAPVPGNAEPGKLNCTDASGAKTAILSRDLDKEWKKALRDGFFTPTAKRPTFNLNARDIGAALDRRQLPASPTRENLEITFAPCPKMLDGRHANNAWLLELPDPITKLVWDNAAIISPDTARQLGISSGDMLKVTIGARTAYVGAWVLTGQAEHSIALTLGWGRKKSGRLGNFKGFDVYPLRATDAMHFTNGVKLAKYGDKYKFGQTQDHNSMEGRPIARETTLADYKARPNFADLESPPPKKLPLWTDQDYVLDKGVAKGHQWGMTIDLNACTGCNACVVACQAENNVPVVGKIEVARGREMHWLRIDRYFVEDPKLGGTKDEPLVVHQPLACVHCEEAPCENVCPVNATVHSPEGLNEMAYNRCIGTRYCANNCPYKVRRFNYLNWHNDGVWTFAEPFSETLHMQQNPNVTVRFRGVMEKCTYCVQRIQSAKIARKRKNEEMKDGDIVVACQQTCPSDAIVFGDLNDPKSIVTNLAKLDRQYKLLGEIGTKPRTTYLGKVRNPNEELLKLTANSTRSESANKEKG